MQHNIWSASLVLLHVHNYYIQARFALLVVEFVSRASTYHYYQDGDHCIEQNHTKIRFAMKTPSGLNPRPSYIATIQVLIACLQNASMQNEERPGLILSPE